MKKMTNEKLEEKKSEALSISTSNIKNKNEILEKLFIDIISLSPYFEKNYYKKLYLKDEDIDPAVHYLTIGYKKGYNPSPLFDTKAYLKANQDVAALNTNPLIHYELYGKLENRTISPVVTNSGTYHSYKVIRWLKRKLARICCHSYIKRNKNKKILVILHLFYTNSFKEIIEYLKNLECYDYDLVVTYVKDSDTALVFDDLKKYKKDVKLVACENYGYDIGPFFEVLKDVNLDNYDIVLKLQSKGTNKTMFIYNQIFAKRDWFLNLFNGILGSFSTHKMIDILASDNQYGLVAADNLIINDPTHKVSLVKERLAEFNYPISNSYQFVAGSCFAVRAKLLKEMQDLHLSLHDFETTTRGFFSFAHAMERLVCISIAKQNYEFYGIKANRLKNLKWHRLEKYLSKYSTKRLINDKNYNFNDDFVWMTLENSLMLDYHVTKMKLKDIKRQYFYDNIISLKECEPYLYLCGDKEAYKKYTKFHQDNNLPSMTEKRFKDLIKSIDKNGYDEKCILVVNEKNIILDGQHRACILLYKYGEEYEQKVLQVHLVVPDFSKLKPFMGKITLLDRTIY